MVRFNGSVGCESELSVRFEIRAALTGLAVVELLVLGSIVFIETLDMLVTLDVIFFMNMSAQLSLVLGINVDDSFKVPLNSKSFPRVVPFRCHLITLYVTSGTSRSMETIVGMVQIAMANLLNFL